MTSKQWGLDSVFYSHGYNNISYPELHDSFIKWIDSPIFDSNGVKLKLSTSPISVVDIGGGNGRVLIKLERYINKYYCLDINPECVKFGSDYFKSNENVKFIKFDIDSQDLNIKCDVVYIDSVLTMLEDPFGALLKFKKVSKYTFVNRTQFGDYTKKESYKWDGMNESSTLWKFDYETMKKFCNNNNMILNLFDKGSFYIINNNR